MPRWTAESRKKQAEIARKHKPWTRSTGPKTDAGKAKSALNATKHGYRSREGQEFLATMRAIRKCRIKLLARDKMRRKMLRLLFYKRSSLRGSQSCMDCFVAFAPRNDSYFYPHLPTPCSLLPTHTSRIPP